MKKYSIPYFLWLLVFCDVPDDVVSILAFTTGEMLDFSTFEFSLEKLCSGFSADLFTHFVEFDGTCLYCYVALYFLLPDRFYYFPNK